MQHDERAIMAHLHKTPSKAISPARRKAQISRGQFEQFNLKLDGLVEQLNSSPNESEEHHKNHISDFLKYAFQFPAHFINTKYKNDLVIRNGKASTDPVGVIIEVKRPANKAEMPTVGNLNVKAMQELVLYYLRERMAMMVNLAVKHLIITNGYEWFIFDVNVFEKTFVQNKALVKSFHDFEAGRLADSKTDFFYKEIAKPAINEMGDVDFTYFDLREKRSEKQAVALLKLLSPEHLLKQDFANDSNSLNKDFYSELLHIIGLIEVKDGSKKLIQRKKEGERNRASLLENAISKMDALDKLRNFEKPTLYGDTPKEQLFNVGLELVITWVNRVLFLKLLEAQLITYHKDDKSYAFLNIQRIRSFDDLDGLFFEVLARKPAEREAEIQKIFAKVPYLNSSLFETTEIERKVLNIGNLSGEITLPLFSSTVLKDGKGKRRTGELNTLEYLFAFLEAYDFASEGTGELKDNNKVLINASVLGLIFEKINGYKDGSFFTPGFITMYMCRETLRRAVVQKFNEVKSWRCKDITALYNQIEDRAEANAIINSLKICDPAVGSGHFLVSALNELIAIKAELRVLQDAEGKRLKDYSIEIINDELLVLDEDGEAFSYNPSNPESARIQKTLFNEKQALIENCLFGVDINPNSVKICRLRLWIELLKNAYYNADGQLETLPNIDINIKVGNSLISRFALDADLKDSLKKSKLTLTDYRKAVDTYRNASSKEQKREMEQVIEKIKNDFRSEILYHDPKAKRLENLRAELKVLELPQTLLEESAKEEKERKQKKEKLKLQFDKLNAEIEEIKNNKIYENAFEWRFEFPEVLNDDGAFVGFDVVIGNPPYGVNFADADKLFLKDKFADIHVRTAESFNYFIGAVAAITNDVGLCTVIIPSSFLSQSEFEKSRALLLRTTSLFLTTNLGDGVFEDVTTPTCIIGFDNNLRNEVIDYQDLTKVGRGALHESLNGGKHKIHKSSLCANISSSFIYKAHQALLMKCYNGRPTLKVVAEEVATGISTGLDQAYVYTHSEIADLQLEQSLFNKLIVGGEIIRYALTPKSNKNILYITNANNLDSYPNISKQLIQFKDKLCKRREAENGKINWYSLNWPRRKKLFDSPKILIRQTANCIMAAYDTEQWYCLKSGLIVQLPENSGISYHYLLGLLNSTLMDFIYRDLVNEDDRIFPEVKPIQLFKLPIEVGGYVGVLEDLVRQILALKKQTPSADTTTLENKIDQLVYALYDLTPEEIAIVEGKSEQGEAHA
jgi:hypothetical protein